MLRTAVAMLLLFASAAPAFAECAWVLWAASPHATPTELIPLGGYDARELCERRAEEENRFGGTQHLCLPDTVNPRGPKGR